MVGLPAAVGVPAGLTPAQLRKCIEPGRPSGLPRGRQMAPLRRPRASSQDGASPRHHVSEHRASCTPPKGHARSQYLDQHAVPLPGILKSPPVHRRSGTRRPAACRIVGATSMLAASRLSGTRGPRRGNAPASAPALPHRAARLAHATVAAQQVAIVGEDEARTLAPSVAPCASAMATTASSTARSVRSGHGLRPRHRGRRRAWRGASVAGPCGARRANHRNSGSRGGRLLDDGPRPESRMQRRCRSPPPVL